MKTNSNKNGPEKETAQLRHANQQGDLFPSRKKFQKPLVGQQPWKLMILALALMLNLGVMPVIAQKADRSRELLGERFNAQSQAPLRSRHLGRRRGAETRARLLHWNSISIDASGLDHTPGVPGSGGRIFGDQLGPGRSSRAIAIVHIAMFDAINAIAGEFQSYTGLPRVREQTSMDAAIAQAAHDTLAALFPAQKEDFDLLLAEDLDEIEGGRRKANGIALGRIAAEIILARRANDGSRHAELRLGTEFIPSDEPGKWRQDPISLIPLAIGAKWDEVRPLVIRSATQFRIPPPPALNSQRHTRAFNEVKRLGGDGITTPTERTEEQTHIGIFWAYDGTPSLCAPPRLYNQITVQIANQQRTNVVDLARLLALVNTSMADAGIASWESKYFYQVARPVTAIREGDPGTGPNGRGDGNPRTDGDVNFSPLGAPASNLTGPNFTPPFPAYPSGHATFGGALFETLRNFYGTDRLPFTFVSDEFNGETKDNEGNVRPLLPRSYRRLSEAEEENGQSRIYLGIHWEYDKTEGITQGRRIADFVFRNAFQPLRNRDRR